MGILDATQRRLRRSQVLSLLAALVVLVFVVFAAPNSWRLDPDGLMRDFNAFYCAGAAIDAHADPYLAEPLGACERAPKPWGLHNQIPHLSMPAPLPPYALAPFAALAHLPYGPAAIVWFALSLACVVACAWALRELTGLPLSATFAALALGDAYDAALTLGQVVPLAVAGITFAAWALARGRFALAALCAAVAMIEPHLGLPACLALFLFVPRTRRALVGYACACFALSLALVGPALNLEYVRTVLPLHALSEIVNEKQLSLTFVAHQLGASDTLALQLGSLSYLLTLAAGLAAARALSVRLSSPGLLVTLPVAFTLAGGPFIHIAQIAAAVPAAAILYSALPERRAQLGLALGLVAIPWAQFLNLGLAFPLFVAITVLTLVWSLGIERPLTVVAITVGAVILSLLPDQFLVTMPDPTAALALAYDPTALAEKTWSVLTHTIAQSNGVAYTVAKLPTWAGLLTIAAISLGETLRESGARRQEHVPANR
jgi:hypothetical protein